MKPLWFDDGLLSTYTVAFPIMKKMGLVGIAAVVTGIVGGEFYSSDGKVVRPCMNIDQLKELIDAGWEIASHSVTHPNQFNTLSLKETRCELTESKKWIMENLGVTPARFVVPRHLITIEQMKLVKTIYDDMRPLGNPYKAFIIFHWLDASSQLRRRLAGRF